MALLLLFIVFYRLEGLTELLNKTYYQNIVGVMLLNGM